MLITLHLERKLTKEQIFEYYANQIYLGRIGTFDIHGYGQAAQAYFNKDIGELTLPEAALLAGLPRGPSRYNPFRNPNNAKMRRAWVLGQMLQTGAISEREYAVAAESELAVEMGRQRGGRRAVLCRPGEPVAPRTLPGPRFSVLQLCDLHLARHEPPARGQRGRSCRDQGD